MEAGNAEVPLESDLESGVGQCSGIGGIYGAEKQMLRLEIILRMRGLLCRTI